MRIVLEVVAVLVAAFVYESARLRRVCAPNGPRGRWSS